MQRLALKRLPFMLCDVQQARHSYLSWAPGRILNALLASLVLEAVRLQLCQSFAAQRCHRQFLGLYILGIELPSLCCFPTNGATCWFYRFIAPHSSPCCSWRVGYCQCTSKWILQCLSKAFVFCCCSLLYPQHCHAFLFPVKFMMRICILATPRLKFDGGTCHWNVGNFIPSKLHLRHSRLTLRYLSYFSSCNCCQGRSCFYPAVFVSCHFMLATIQVQVCVLLWSQCFFLVKRPSLVATTIIAYSFPLFFCTPEFVWA